MPISIILAEDMNTTSGENRLGALADMLRESGHEVLLFNGRTDAAAPDNRITDPDQASHIVGRMILDHGVTGMVVDLQWFGIANYMIRLLRGLKTRGLLPHNMKIVVLSAHLDDANSAHRRVMKEEFSLPESQMFNRLTTRFEAIEALFP